MIYSSEEAFSEILQVLPHAAQVTVISAYIKLEPLKIIAERSDRKPIISVVGRFLPLDFISEASDFSVLDYCLSNDIQIYMLNNLHAKIYQVDNNDLFVGSANCTNNGFSIVGRGNIEALVRLSPNEDSRTYIHNIFNSSIRVNYDILQYMRSVLDSRSTSESTSLTSWPDSITFLSQAYLVSDFPIAGPSEKIDFYTEHPFLPFAIIEKQDDVVDKKIRFLNSRAYAWLVSNLLSKENCTASFGELTQDLHTVLSDDPSPYRSTVKSILSNMYKYVALYASDDILIWTPGRRSQLMKFIGCK